MSHRKQMTKICPYCNREGHLRRSHWNCLERIDRSRIEANEQQQQKQQPQLVEQNEDSSPEKPRCNSCVRLVHSRRSH